MDKAQDQSAEREALPPLPTMIAAYNQRGTVGDRVQLYTSGQMREYARAALSTRAAPAQECSRCKGGGLDDASGFGDFVTCEECGGSGRVTAREAPARTVLPGLLDALRHQRQLDEDGVEVAVSREAVDKAIELLGEAPAAAPQAPTTDPAPPAAKAVGMDADDTKRLDWLFENCRIIFCPPPAGSYPIEHNPHALGYGSKRDSTPILQFADAALSKQGGKG